MQLNDVLLYLMNFALALPSLLWKEIIMFLAAAIVFVVFRGGFVDTPKRDALLETELDEDAPVS